MLHDKAKIYVEAGRGGDGCVGFRREANVPKGGPDGGDGGHGGDVVLVADSSLRDLSSFRQSKHFKADDGGNGSGSQRHGADGEVLEIPVAVGTVVTDAESGHIYDMCRSGQKAVVSSGGKGGRGNKQFAGPTRQTPRFAEKGTRGEATALDLQLKLLADVALVGMPNAGKSSLLSRITRAHPKIADYPFTTTEPVLGTVERDGRQLVVADVPGLIKGAAEGVGLGHEFLAHVERTKLLVHVVEVLPVDGSDPKDNFQAVEHEIVSYDPAVAGLQRIVALSKCDLVDDREMKRVSESLATGSENEVSVRATSSATGLGLKQLVDAMFKSVTEGSKGRAPEVLEPAQYKLYTPAEGRELNVSRESPGVFRIGGKGVEALVERFDLENREALDYLEQKLKRLGVIEMLEREGFKSGDEICIGGAGFELWV